MKITDIIRAKRDKNELSREQIFYFINNYTAGAISDYQASALLMAIYLNGMSRRETLDMTEAMTASGQTLDLSGVSAIKADKHSTGGVGDKTSLVVCPVLASLGIKMAKMSGRGLGFTGGTIDKLESIPGFKTDLSRERLIAVLNETGMCMIAQSEDLAPADKKLYALRDVTATVESLPLICASIMSKKLSCGADVLVFDVKCGDGAFMKNYEQARELACIMCDIARMSGKKAGAVVSDMSFVLGKTVGNMLELKEALSLLKGGGPHDLYELCRAICVRALLLSGFAAEADCIGAFERAIKSGAAYETFIKTARAQGAQTEYLENSERFGRSRYEIQITAKAQGYISAAGCDKIGECAMLLGAGRAKKGDPVDHKAGIILHKTQSEYVRKGELLASLYTDLNNTDQACALFESAIEITPGKPPERKLILEQI